MPVTSIASLLALNLAAFQFGALDAPAQRPLLSAIGNAASYAAGGVAPGEIVVLYGAQIGPTTLAKASPIPGANRFPTTLAGTTVFFDSVPAPVIYVSATQSSVVVPYSVAGKTTVSVRIEFQGQTTGTLSVPVVLAEPGLFSLNSSGSGPGAFFNQDNTLNSNLNPIHPGEVLVMFGTGEGQTSPTGVDGSLAVGPTYPKPAQTFEVTIGGRRAEVLYFGAAPGFIAGLLQINVVIPAGTPAGAQPVVVKVGNSSSRPANPITVAVGGAAPTISSNFGRPGQKITITNGETYDLHAIEMAVLRFANGTMAPALIDVETGGRLSFYVPYLQDNTTPLGYLTGPCTISLKRGDLLTGAIPFRIDELQAVADAPAKFKIMINDIARYVKGKLDRQESISDFGGLPGAIKPLADRTTEPLLRMADEVAASGSAQLPLNSFGGSGPSVTITARHLEHIVAMVENDPPPTTGLTANAAFSASLSARPAVPSSHCLSNLKWYSYCSLEEAYKTPQQIAVESLYAPAFFMLRRAVGFGLGPPKPSCSILPQEISSSVLVSTFLPALGTAACKLWPTKPTAFSAKTFPSPIPLGDFDTSANQGTEINVHFTRYWPNEFAVDQVLKSAFVYGTNAVARLSQQAGCSAQFASAYKTIAESMFTSARDELILAMNGAGRGSLASQADELVNSWKLSSCDVDTLLPQLTSVRYRGEKDRILNGVYRWGLEGRNQGIDEVIINNTKESFPPERFGSYGFCDSTTANYFHPLMEMDYWGPNWCVKVEVAPPIRGLFLTGYTLKTIRRDVPTAVTVPPTEVLSELTYSDNNPYNGISKLTLKKISDSKYQIIQEVRGSTDTTPDSDGTNTWNKVNGFIRHLPGPRKVRMTVKVNITGACQGVDATMVSYSNISGLPIVDRKEDDGNNGCSASWVFEGFSLAGANLNNRITFDIGAFVVGGRGATGGPGTGTVTTDIELLDDATAPSA